MCIELFPKSPLAPSGTSVLPAARPFPGKVPPAQAHRVFSEQVDATGRHRPFRRCAYACPLPLRRRFAVLPRDALLDLDLDAQQRRLERDVVRRDADDSEERRDVLPVLPREEVVGGLVPEAPADVGVDVRHHQRDAALREAVERRRLRVGRALREDEADELVVALDVRLLAGGVGVAVEHGREPAAVGVELDPGGVGELRAVVREDDREEAREHLSPAVLPVVSPQGGDDGRENPQHAFARLRVDGERQHEVEGVEEERQQGLPSPGALHGVHLDDAHAGMLRDELQVVVPRPSDAARPVHPVLHPLAPAGLDHAGPRQVVPLRREQPAVDVAVGGLEREREPVGVVDHGRVYGLPPVREVPERPVAQEQLALGDVRAGAGLREDRLVGLLRLGVEVAALPEDAFALVPAAVADERGPLEPPAPLLHERGAVRVALAAEPALPLPVVEAVDADPAPPALHPERAPVGDAVGRALVGLDRAGPDLPRDRRDGA